MYKKQINKEIITLIINDMAPRDVETLEEKVEKKFISLGDKLDTFMLSTVQRLTRLETILYVVFGSNSVATIILFILNLKK